MNLTNFLIIKHPVQSVFLVLIFSGVGFYIGQTGKETISITAQNNFLTMSECVDKLKTTKTVAITLADLQAISNHCYHQIYSQWKLDDFHIRRMAFDQQRYADNVILWMVVLLTFSGVGMATFQLYASYRLEGASAGAANLEQTQEVIIEKGKFVFKSSVIGVFILLISFAFFFVFVENVYKLSELGSDSNTGGNFPVVEELGSRIPGGELGHSSDDVNGN